MDLEQWEGRQALETALEEMMAQKPGQKPSASKIRGVAKTSLECRSEYKRIVHTIERFVKRAPPHVRLSGASRSRISNAPKLALQMFQTSSVSND